jgi:pimeloyl-ACP methyl ester carboxylesterase
MALELHDDWGVRCERWRGVRSEQLDVLGTPVHVLRADGPADGTPHLLVHGLGGASINWLEVIPSLARLGPVVAPDLPGFGLTRPPRPKGSRVGANARFLRVLLDRLGWDHAVVHGNSMGGMLGVLLGEIAPDRIDRLVLASPALPSPPTALHRTRPQTLARFAPFVLPGLGRLVLSQVWGRNTAEDLWRENVAYLHADPSRVRPELSEVGLANLEFGRQQPWRVEGMAAAAESLVERLMVSGGLWRAVSEVSAPTLLLWGDADRLIGRPVFDEVRRRRPDWDHQVFEGAGHCPQIEVPHRYVDAVASWTPQRPDSLSA